MFQQDYALTNQQWLIYVKTQPIKSTNFIIFRFIFSIDRTMTVIITLGKSGAGSNVNEEETKQF